MLFKFPQKKIILDCFTDKEYVLESAPIVSAMKHTPDWWKDLPVSYMENNHYPKGTMKNCIGFTNYYKHSFVLPLWSDLAIKITEDKNYFWQFSDQITSANVHNIQKQATNLLNNFGHIKIDSPWLFKEKQGIKFIWSHPTYNYENSNDVVSFPAIIDYKNQHGTNINLMVNLENSKNILIPHGQPMAFITPMTENKVEIVRHLISTEEMNKIAIAHIPITFIKRYSESIKKKSKFKTCPFHRNK
jgi:hypothetical protein